ncbi:TPA: type II toxin-antitoxin system HipA family toxin [Pseudomonas aeruginosa]|uniref:type II toxin-antitoxin system HipA family toxin n=1 Tax=Pseudomonas aeruginosa TaxID=287 RepID=UPI0027EE08A5|nr:type II toxin-antitoxin system HipA family toxin [Pseudomonas aeruginosa]EKY4113582.1 type II toxin-antitoxin system HipA family toxin [Pseudomonas aeruginosa]ELJ2276104.1 type II toxin-antitoxin system HipA family toxin [Pseudomonas aeruginosa]MBX6653819.1 type II toxin-antitoxin system HipA family toxin [Pseudomonas aeruginosa]MCS8414906.1 type II toxin-antitoxin system HipA family toxin [Pseudomonas aeruginosa]
MSKALQVSFYDVPVGELTFEGGHLQFAYSQAWLDDPKAVPLSVSLPLRPEPFMEKACRPFFAGLLPEGAIRKALAQQLRVSEGNDFAVLESIGGECAGAVSLAAMGDVAEPIPVPEPAVRWLSEAELEKVISDLPMRPMLAGEDGIRLSLAGAQNKLPVVLEHGKIGVPENGHPSTHILKPAISSLEGSVINEAFCLDLAAACGIRAAKVQMGRAGEAEYLLVERYDREILENGQVRRLHQEDFCQAMGVSSELKYQNEGGPGLRACFDLVRKHTRPSAIHLLALLNYVSFSVMVGNNDAHGKNYSLLQTSRDPVLAPLYDVLCTSVYERLSDKMAMKIGSKYKFTEVQDRHWATFVSDAGLSFANARKIVIALADRIDVEAAKLAAQPPYAGNDLIERIMLKIGRNTRLVRERFNPPKMNA